MPPTEKILINTALDVERNNFQLEKSKILKEFECSIFGEVLLKKRIEMIFRASEHHFKAEKFHLLCDGKFPTIVIIKSNFGKIFGRYTNSKWGSDDKWVIDDTKSSFIFSTHKSSKHSIIHPKHSIYAGKGHGPIFGKGYDIYISNNCNTNTNSCCNLGNSYSLNNSNKSDSI